jgi:hypothetical protein
MLMLRTGGQFTDTQIRKYFISATIFVAVAVVGLLATRYSELPLIGLVVTGLAITAFRGNVRRWRNWSAGKLGETAVAEALKSLSNDYVLLNDLTLPNGYGNVDHLVIGPNGIFVIETKNYSGYIKCWGDKWYVNGRRIRSLSKQAKRNAIGIKNNLEKVFTEHRTRMPYVNGLLVFVNRKGKLNIKEPTVPVVRASELSRFLARFDRARPRSLTSSVLLRAIVHHLHILQQPPDKSVGNR